MTGVKETTFNPIPENHAVYKKLYSLYKQLHDSFGIAGHCQGLDNVMKDLLKIKTKANS